MITVWIIVGAVGMRLLWPASVPPQHAITSVPLPTANSPDPMTLKAEQPIAPDGETIRASILAALQPPPEKPVELPGIAAIERAALPLLLALPVPVPVESLEDLTEIELNTYAELPRVTEEAAHDSLVAAILASRAEAAEPSPASPEPATMEAPSATDDGASIIAAIMAALEPAAGEAIAQAGDDHDEAPTPVIVPVTTLDVPAVPEMTVGAEPGSTAAVFSPEAALTAFLEAAAETASAHAAEPPSAEAVDTAIMAEILAALTRPDTDIATVPVVPAESASIALAPIRDGIIVPPIASGDAPIGRQFDRETVIHATEPPPVPTLATLVDAILVAATPAGDGEPGPVIAQLQQPAPAPPAAQAPATLPAPVSVEAAAQAVRFLARGDELLEIGDIAGARLFYERAARTGNVPAMIALARTYEPEVLRQRGVIGLTADPARAQFWYGRAAAAGAPTKSP